MRYSAAVPVTKSDTVDISPGVLYDGLFVGGTGTVVLVLPDNSTMTITAVAANTILPFVIKRVNSTSTTATSMFALKI